MSLCCGMGRAWAGLLESAFFLDRVIQMLLHSVIPCGNNVRRRCVIDAALAMAFQTHAPLESDAAGRYPVRACDRPATGNGRGRRRVDLRPAATRSRGQTRLISVRWMASWRGRRAGIQCRGHRLSRLRAALHLPSPHRIRRRYRRLRGGLPAQYRRTIAPVHPRHRRRLVLRPDRRAGCPDRRSPSTDRRSRPLRDYRAVRHRPDRLRWPERLLSGHARRVAHAPAGERWPSVPVSPRRTPHLTWTTRTRLSGRSTTQPPRSPESPVDPAAVRIPTGIDHGKRSGSGDLHKDRWIHAEGRATFSRTGVRSSDIAVHLECGSAHGRSCPHGIAASCSGSAKLWTISSD